MYFILFGCNNAVSVVSITVLILIIAFVLFYVIFLSHQWFGLVLLNALSELVTSNENKTDRNILDSALLHCECEHGPNDFDGHKLGVANLDKS